VVVLGVAVPAQLLFLVTGIAVTTLLSLASWHLYEKHFLKLKGRFEYGSGRSREPVLAGGAATAASLAGGGDRGIPRPYRT
jgi:peptidoglycan/LPS O-acetylase OafA/YrhL